MDQFIFCNLIPEGDPLLAIAFGLPGKLLMITHSLEKSGGECRL